MKLIILGSFCAICVFLLLPSCNSENEIGDKDVLAVSYKLLVTDTLFKTGLDIGSTQGGNSSIVGKFDYDGKAKGNAFWKIAQWYCLNNDLTTARYTVFGDELCYAISDEGNKVYVDTTKGTLTLELNTDTEYGLNGVTSNPREAGQVWPHLLIEHNWEDSTCLKISDKKEIIMEISYVILKCEDKIPEGTTNTSLHTSQFQWYITVQNRNKLSSGYGSEYIWFGLNFFDNRYDYMPFYAAQDAGKEYNTGAFIYMPAMEPILSAIGKTEIGKTMTVKQDILPFIKSAYNLAHERHYLSNTTWNDLFIGSTNVGWEVTGTYNVSVKISKINIFYK